MGGSIGDPDHSVRGSTINNCCAGTRADHRHSNLDSEILRVSPSGDPDGISRCRQRNGMPDGLAGSRSRQTVVRVSPAHPIYVPRVVADAIGARARSNAVPSSLSDLNLMTRLRVEKCRLARRLTL